MKNKALILFMSITILGFVILVIIHFNHSSVLATVILDINPSIEIGVDKNNNVVSIMALNNDGKEIINDIKGRPLDNAISTIVDNIIGKSIIEDNYVVILLYTTGNINEEELQNDLIILFEEKNIKADIVPIHNITKEDKELAEQHHISISKASYINNLVKDNENLGISGLANKSVRELKEIKDTGNYCAEGYSLEGTLCLKEMKREAATQGDVCPNMYYEYKGKCYFEKPSEFTGRLLCNDGFQLIDNKCIRQLEISAKPIKYSCTKGAAITKADAGLTNTNAGDANEIVCVDYSSATHPVSPCELPANDPTERMSYGGKCYWHKAPVIATGCPGKIKVNGFCWDDATDILICAGYRDGKQYKTRDEYCEHSINYSDPLITEYTCPKDYRLDGSKCYGVEYQDPFNELNCPSEFSLVDNRCINTNILAKKEKGYLCDGENTRLKGTECIFYEITGAMHQ